jgi:hypothetical protein
VKNRARTANELDAAWNIRQERRAKKRLTLHAQPQLTDPCVCTHDFGEHDSSRASSPCARRNCGCSAFRDKASFEKDARAAASCVARISVNEVAKLAGIELDMTEDPRTRVVVERVKRDELAERLMGRPPVAPAEPTVRIAVALERIAGALEQYVDVFAPTRKKVRP